MTTTAEKIKVMQAFEDGETLIATQDVSGLESEISKEKNGEYKFNFFAESFRIKPKPKVIWVNEFDNNYPLAYWDKAIAESDGRNDDSVSILATGYIELTREVKAALESKGIEL